MSHVWLGRLLCRCVDRGLAACLLILRILANLHLCCLLNNPSIQNSHKSHKYQNWLLNYLLLCFFIISKYNIAHCFASAHPPVRVVAVYIVLDDYALCTHTAYCWLLLCNNRAWSTPSLQHNLRNNYLIGVFLRLATADTAASNKKQSLPQAASKCCFSHCFL